MITSSGRHTFNYAQVSLSKVFSAESFMSQRTKKTVSKADAVTKKPRLTHFLCVPLVNPLSRPQLETSIQRFKDDVCSPPEDLSKPPVITEKAIRPVGAIHLTLGVMSLSSETLAEATEMLKQIQVTDLLHEAKSKCLKQAPRAIVPVSPQPGTTGPIEPRLDTLTRPISPPPVPEAPKPMTISLKSLVSMHPPHKTSILYTAPDDPSERLHALCLILRTRFQDAGFLIEDTRPLKLHATLVNTIYAKGRKPRGRGKQQREKPPPSAAQSGCNEAEAEKEPQEDRSEGHGPDAKAPLRINAADILNRYTDFVWAENVQLDRIAICEMGAKKVLNEKGEVISEEYKEIAVLRLPTT